jgi:hypothetical protein
MNVKKKINEEEQENKGKKMKKRKLMGWEQKEEKRSGRKYRER